MTVNTNYVEIGTVDLISWLMSGISATLKTQVRKRSVKAQEPVKRFKGDTRPQIGLPQELGELIQRDVAAVRKLGWEEFLRERRGKGDLTDMSLIPAYTKTLRISWSTH